MDKLSLNYCSKFSKLPQPAVKVEKFSIFQCLLFLRISTLKEFFLRPTEDQECDDEVNPHWYEYCISKMLKKTTLIGYCQHKK